MNQRCTKNSLISLSLCTVLMLCAVSCGTETPIQPEKESTDTVPPETEAETEYLETLPEKDFGGKPFIILAEDRTGLGGIQNKPEDELNGDVINDAVFQRDIKTEERYNTDLQYITAESRALIADNVRKAVQADDEAYHLILGSMSESLSILATGRFLYSMTELPHLSLSSPWWLPDTNSRLYVKGNLYFAASPVTPTYFTTPFAMCYNMTLAEKYDIPDMYDEVASGKWTFDRLTELTKDISADLDGDGKMTENDLWGFASHTSALWGYYVSSGLTPLTIADDGSYHLDLLGTKSVDTIEKLSSVISDTSRVYVYDGSNPMHSTMFTEGKVLFADYSILGFLLEFRDMKDEWGILPMPKHSDDQKTYVSTLQTLLPCAAAVPMNCSVPEDTGLILEALTYISNADLYDAVYETVLSGKVARNEKSEQMLDLIYKNVNVDLLYIYRFANVNTTVTNAIAKGTPFVSAYESSAAELEKQINTFLDAVEAASD